MERPAGPSYPSGEMALRTDLVGTGVAGARAAVARRHAVAFVVAVGGTVTATLAVLTALDVARLGDGWENATWTAAAVTAVAASAVGAVAGEASDRRIRTGLAGALSLLLVGQLVRDAMSLSGGVPIPSLVDAFFLGTLVPILAAVVGVTRRIQSGPRAVAVFLDAAAVFFALLALVIVLQPAGAGADSWTPEERLRLAYPVGFLGTAGAIVVAAIANRARIAPRGPYLLALGTLTIGVAYSWSLDSNPTNGLLAAVPVYLMAPGLILCGIGGATVGAAREVRPRFLRLARTAEDALPVGAGIVAAVLLLVPTDHARPGHIILELAVAATMLLLVARQTILLRERSGNLDELREAHEAAEAALASNQELAAQLQARIDEMRRVEAQLVQASKRTAVAELAAAVAHEVNNPLTGVLGYADLLLNDLPPDGRGREELETIRTQALRARDIIHGLLDFARRRAPQRLPTDLNALAASTLGLVRYHFERSWIRIEEKYGELPLVDCDPADIGQVLLSLVTNAAQAMPEGGSLRIETRVDGDAALLIVADDGSGMDEATAARAFEPFFTTQPLEAGRGLGLAVSLSIVQAHEGTIEVVTGAGAGTTVTVRLPIVATSPAPAPVPVPASAPAPVAAPVTAATERD